MVNGLKRRRWLLVTLAVVIAVVTGIYLYGKGSGGQPRFRTDKVERGGLRSIVSTTGTLNAVITVQVGTQVSGQIRELSADFNSNVKKGQLIARIDPQTFEAKVNQARADVESAQAQVLNQRAQLERARAEVAASQAQVLNQQSQVERANAEVERARSALASARAQTVKARVALLDARQNLDRRLDLFAKELISRSERDTAQAAHDSAQAQVEASEAQEEALASSVRSALAQVASSRAQVQAFTAAVRSTEAQLKVAEAQLTAAEATVRQKQAGLQQAQVDLGNTFIRSPVDGVVVSRNVDVGQTVAASLSAPTLFTIAQDLSKMQVDTNVDEADMGRIDVGQRATFTVDSFRGETFSGAVTQIRKAAKVVQNVVTYNVVVEVDNPRQKLLPGLTANVRIIIDSRKDVLKVPNAALRFRPDEGGESSGDGGGRIAAPARATSVAAAEELLKQLTDALKLTEDQQRAIVPVLEEQRRQLMGLDRIPSKQRRSATLRVREETQEKIRPRLTAQQRAVFETLPVGQSATREARPGMVWIADGRGSLRSVPLQLGISDGSSTEVIAGDLKDGEEVIVGTSLSSATPSRAPASSQSPASTPRLRF